MTPFRQGSLHNEKQQGLSPSGQIIPITTMDREMKFSQRCHTTETIPTNIRHSNACFTVIGSKMTGIHLDLVMELLAEAAVGAQSSGSALGVEHIALPVDHRVKLRYGQREKQNSSGDFGEKNCSIKHIILDCALCTPR